MTGDHDGDCDSQLVTNPHPVSAVYWHWAVCTDVPAGNTVHSSSLLCSQVRWVLGELGEQSCWPATAKGIL